MANIRFYIGEPVSYDGCCAIGCVHRQFNPANASFERQRLSRFEYKRSRQNFPVCGLTDEDFSQKICSEQNGF